MTWLALWLYLALQVDSSESNSSPILVDGVRQLAPKLDEATAKLHVEAASAATRTGVEPSLLLAVAFVESHYDPSYTSRVEATGRVIGRSPSWRPVGTGRRFCGVMQTQAGNDWLTCLAMRSLAVGYIAGAIELRWWLRYTRGDVVLALRGHGCGFAGLENGCHGYAERVLRRKSVLDQAAW
jgi:hypothetical protein